MRTLGEWGNSLHSGEITYQIVAHRKRWFAVGALLMAVSIVGLVAKGGLNAGIEFRGGTQYVITDVAQADVAVAKDAVAAAYPEAQTVVAVVGGNDIQVQLDALDADQVPVLGESLAKAYDVPVASVSSQLIGPTWGADVSKKAFTGLAWFLVLVTIFMSVYFRAWRMAVAGLVALIHDLVFTVGIYTLSGFEVSPATVIGFLTILGYSLYDTVVVFDKVRENTANVLTQHRYTYDELANLAVNQTLVRSINTSVVALLPVSAILFIGSFLLGAGTLKDIALALFVGMAVGTFSSIFIATPFEVWLRDREPKIVEHTRAVLAMREGSDTVAVRPDGTVRVGALVPGHHQGTSAQPKRKARGK